MKIAIVAGGTGGHIYPGIAIAEEIRRRHPESDILFIGSHEGLEKELIPRAGFSIRLILARALLRKVSYKALSAPFASTAGFFQSLSIFRSFRPEVLVSTGGYVSLPAVIAAKLCSIPVYLHEQNVLPGFTHRLVKGWAKKFFLSFEETLRYTDGIVTGNPVRREIIEADREKARQKMGFSPNETVVLVMGGSQGARKINQNVISALPLLENKFRALKIIHIVGKRDAKLAEGWLGNRKYAFYQKFDYLYNIADALAASDLAVARAGATAIAEFLAREVSMVLIPFPFSAERHQELNAQVTAASGAAVIVNNDEFVPEKFISLLANLDIKQMKTNCRKLARPRAAEEIVRALA